MNETLTRECFYCRVVKPYSEFYLRESGIPQGRKCKKCLQKEAREKSMIPEVRENRLIRQRLYREKYSDRAKINSINYYQSIHGRAATLMKGIKDRDHKYPEELDFDQKFLEEKLKNGYCEITGIEFDLSTKGDSKKNPFAPSIDRIDSSIGYIKSNVRLILWQVNLMKGELSDSDLLKMCEVVIANAKNLRL